MEQIKGTDAFLNSSDSFFKKIATFIDDYEVDNEKLSELRDICEIVKITAMTIKTLKEESVKDKSDKKSGSRVDRNADERRNK